MLIITIPVIKPTMENPFCSQHEQVCECPDPWPGGWAAGQGNSPSLGSGGSYYTEAAER